MISTSNPPNKSVAKNELARKADGELQFCIDSYWIGTVTSFLSLFVQHTLKP